MFFSFAALIYRRLTSHIPLKDSSSIMTCSCVEKASSFLVYNWFVFASASLPPVSDLFPDCLHLYHEWQNGKEDSCSNCCSKMFFASKARNLFRRTSLKTVAKLLDFLVDIAVNMYTVPGKCVMSFLGLKIYWSNPSLQSMNILSRNELPQCSLKFVCWRFVLWKPLLLAACHIRRRK